MVPDTDEQLRIIRATALKSAKVSLADVGIDVNNPKYAVMQYELQYAIYHELKKLLKIKTT